MNFIIYAVIDLQSPILYFHDQQTSNSLFGGLVKSRVFSPFPVLEIPDLSDDPQQRYQLLGLHS